MHTIWCVVLQKCSHMLGCGYLKSEWAFSLKFLLVNFGLVFLASCTTDVKWKRILRMPRVAAGAARQKIQRWVHAFGMKKQNKLK